LLGNNSRLGANYAFLPILARRIDERVEATLNDMERAERLPIKTSATGLEGYNGQDVTL
jgi:hypothetical protein